ncbi:TetR family transcriptional regulator [Sphingobacteriaceae bacterium]|nr:TetR family transcriptional regulator [Sphingobacteriaceae bacterium]
MDRKQKISEVALNLFAHKGYRSTTTQLIAQEAGVSEALIFKHFGNKEQLLTFIIKSGYKRVIEQNRGMMKESDPRKFIFNIIELPYKLVTEEPDFWELQSRLMFMDISGKQHAAFIKPVYALLVKAFSELDYKKPEKETELLLLLVDALWKLKITQPAEIKKMQAFIKEKYSL